MMMGRQMLRLIYEAYKIADGDLTVMDTADLLRLQMKNRNLQAYWSDWEMLLMRLRKRPDDEMLEALFKLQISKDQSLTKRLDDYDYEINFKGSKPSYEKLTEVVRIELESRAYKRNRNALIDTRQEALTVETCPKDGHTGDLEIVSGETTAPGGTIT